VSILVTKLVMNNVLVCSLSYKPRFVVGMLFSSHLGMREVFVLKDEEENIGCLP